MADKKSNEESKEVRKKKMTKSDQSPIKIGKKEKDVTKKDKKHKKKGRKKKEWKKQEIPGPRKMQQNYTQNRNKKIRIKEQAKKKKKGDQKKHKERQ